MCWYQSSFLWSLPGLYNVVPAEWLQMFDWRELQTMISGTSTPVSMADLKEHCVYSGEYTAKHKTIQMFWQVLEQFTEQQSRQLLKFVTSCSRPPLLGFKVGLEELFVSSEIAYWDFVWSSSWNNRIFLNTLCELFLWIISVYYE